jgi:RNA recognition motif-containing protein
VNYRVNTKLYVGGVSYSTTDEGLKNEFEKAGIVISAKIIIDRETGRSKGFGFVEMSSVEQAQKAIELFNGNEMDGRVVKVSEAKQKSR